MVTEGKRLRFTMRHTDPATRTTAATLLKRAIGGYGGTLRGEYGRKWDFSLEFDLPPDFPPERIDSLRVAFGSYRPEITVWDTPGAALVLPPTAGRYPEETAVPLTAAPGQRYSDGNTLPRFQGTEDPEEISRVLLGYLASAGISITDAHEVDRWHHEIRIAARRLAELAAIGPDEEGRRRDSILEGVESMSPHLARLESGYVPLDADLRVMGGLGIVSKPKTGWYRIRDEYVSRRAG